ncbi:helix-turn-helix transcriptional regulator [Burkholderia pseudomallei]|uniref:helix-turn-helix transcriptional regulator n=2 Tax=Burkholderia pseudomallei TaxID=28450 RepID=UPI0021554FF9|nr:AlpA family phage regulatory protein [Burkholderia pseudomallei]
MVADSAERGDRGVARGASRRNTAETRTDPIHGKDLAYATVMARPLDKALRILRMKQLIERMNLSRAMLYVLMSTDPTFPRKIKLTARSIGFLESEVDAWITSRAQSRDIAG